MQDLSRNYLFFFTERDTYQFLVLRDILFIEHCSLDLKLHDIRVCRHLSSIKCLSSTKHYRTDDFEEVIQEEVF